MLKMLKYLNIKQCPVTVFWTILTILFSLFLLSSWFRVPWYNALGATGLGILLTFWTYVVLHESMQIEHIKKDLNDSPLRAFKEKEPKRIGKDYYL